MSEPQSIDRMRWRRYEPLLVGTMVFLKLNVLYQTWGNIQGFDCGGWVRLMQLTHWFEHLPSTRSTTFSYHPPLSYLLGRLVYTIYPHAVEASQILSTLAIFVALFSLRSTLRRIGWLHTLPGLWLLYGGMSIPLFVWLGIETTYDTLVLAWVTLALAVSVSAFWDRPLPNEWWKLLAHSVKVTALGFVLGCGLMTKFNALFACAIPFLVIVARRGISAFRRELSGPVVAVAVGFVMVGPFYNRHFREPEGAWMPISMEWLRPNDLVAARAERDRAPVGYALNMVRIPENSSSNPQEPILDSLPSMIWLQTWTRDNCLGEQPKNSLLFSWVYSRLFALTTVLGSIAFFARRKHIASAWKQLGWVLLGISAMYMAAALQFGYKYPLWDWRIFKAKYFSPALYWVVFASGLFFGDLAWLQLRSRWRVWAEEAAFLALIAFAFANHLLPVY